MKYLHSFSILIILICLSSCSTINEFTLQQLSPASIYFPQEIKSIGVINSTFSNSHCNELTPKMSGNLNLCSKEFAKRIADAHYFDKVIISDSSLVLPIDSTTNTLALKKDNISNLCSQMGVDALCVFDVLNIDFLELNNNSFTSFPLLSGIVRPILHIYMPNRTRPLCTLDEKDTLYWDIMPTMTAQFIIDDASTFAAEKFAKMVVPYWENITRSYFDGGNVNMRDAGVLLRENKMEESKKLWENIYNKGKRNSSNAAYNIALYYESIDDLDKALFWINNSLKKVSKENSIYNIISLYKIQLEQRKNNYSKLELQMSRFKQKKAY